MSAIIDFDAVAHEYHIGTVRVPSVTTILNGVGLIDFSRVPEPALELGRERGQKAHTLIQYHLTGELDGDSVDPGLAGYLRAAIEWMRISGFEPTACEHRLYHPTYHYAGTADMVGWLGGRPTVLDWKTGRASDAIADLQLAAYASALAVLPPVSWIDVTPSTPVQRLSVELHPDGTSRSHHYTRPHDFALFLNCLAIYREQERRGVRRTA